MAVIDAKGCVVGRLASKVAERLLNSEHIEIVNAEHAIFTGSKKVLIDRYRTRFNLTVKGNPEKGSAKWSKMPDQIVKRAVRGMLPWKTSAGREAYAKLKVHIGVPNSLSKSKAQTLDSAKPKSEARTMTVGELAKEFGAKF